MLGFLPILEFSGLVTENPFLKKILFLSYFLYTLLTIVKSVYKYQEQQWKRKSHSFGPCLRRKSLLYTMLRNKLKSAFTLLRQGFGRASNRALSAAEIAAISNATK